MTIDKIESGALWVYVHPLKIVVSMTAEMETNELFEHSDYLIVLNKVKQYIKDKDYNNLEDYILNSPEIKQYVSKPGEQMSMF